MTGIDSWSVTPATNATADGGSINWAEGQAPSSVNNTARQQTADLRSGFNDLAWFQYGTGDQGAGNLAVPGVYSSATAFTITGADVTTVYHAGRRVRAVGSSTGTIYGSISSSSYNSGNTKTTVNMTWDSGSLSNETLVISLSQVPVTGLPVPQGGVKRTQPTRQVLTSGSGATYTTPSGVVQLRIRMLGGGGGGATGNTGTAGNAGGFSSFDNAGTNYKANAGAGGTGTGNGGAGGSGGTGGSSPTTIRYKGNDGGDGNQSTAGTNAGGYGASTFLGGGNRSTTPTANTGAGGTGQSSVNNGGGGGGAGEYVEIIINSPSATYTYTIGAAGTKGAAGAGDGASGIIIVDEYYGG